MLVRYIAAATVTAEWENSGAGFSPQVSIDRSCLIRSTILLLYVFAHYTLFVVSSPQDSKPKMLARAKAFVWTGLEDDEEVRYFWAAGVPREGGTA